MGVPVSEAKYYAQTTPLYWGDQPFVEAPPYLGVSVVLLALLGLFLIKGRLRWWLIGGMVLSLLLSWGKNFDGLTRFFVDYVPLYNKFRAVSSIQVLLEFLIPIAAVFGLHRFYNERIDVQLKTKKLFIATGIIGGLCLIFYLLGGSLFMFRSAAEAPMAMKQPEILNAIKADRISIMKSDSLRSLLFVILVAGVLWFTLKKKLSENMSIVLIALVLVIDLVSVNRQSVNEDDFITEREYAKSFEPTEADMKIMEDDGYFRVLDLYRGFNNSHTSYFFNTLNGYSAVYPRRMDDIINQVYEGNVGIINMLNVKYLLQKDEGKMITQTNTYANGPAWFINEMQFVSDYNAEYEALKTIETRNTVVIRDLYKQELENVSPQRDSLATVTVTDIAPNAMTYVSSNSQDGFIVFSEAYYENGWQATIDGTPATIYPVNYMLRGLKVPAGKHTITFRFEPEVVKQGSTITLVSSILLFLLAIGGIVYSNKKRSKEVEA
jgi:hypothetical protein